MKRDHIYLVVIVFLSIALMFTYKNDFFNELASGAIGTILTVVITMLLLNKQTETESLKDKSSKIFEKKLEIYDEFLKKLSQIIQDSKIDDKEENELLFQLAIIEQHTKGDNTDEISKQLNNIIALLKPNENDEVNIDKEELSKSLFTIVGIFQIELYDKKLRTTDLTILNSNVKSLINEIEASKEKWSKVIFDDFENYKAGQKLRGTTNEILELIKFIDSDIRKTFENTQIRMSNTHYAFFIGAPGKGNRYFGVSPEKNKLRIGFPKNLVDTIPSNAIIRPSWPDTFSIYITTVEEYQNQIKELTNKNYDNVLLKLVEKNNQ